MITFHHLIKTNFWSSIMAVIGDLYPEWEDKIERYEDAFHSLKLIVPEDKKMLMVLTNEERNGEKTVRVWGKYKHKRHQVPTLRFLPWCQLLGMEISSEAQEEFSDLEIIVHGLNEMTQAGYDDEVIQKTIQELMEMAQEEETQTVDEFFEELEAYDLGNSSDLGDFDDNNKLEKDQLKRINAYYQSSVAEFEGLSPDEMNALQTKFLKDKCPLILNQLSEEELKKSPLLMQVRFLIDKLKGGRELKLTKTGALPLKLVKEIYNLGQLKCYFVDIGLYKLREERRALEIKLTRILLQQSSLAKLRKGKLSLTKKGENSANNGNIILREILIVLFYKFNWGSFDGDKGEDTGSLNAAFSLFLLKKYGDEKRMAHFYAEKYFRALPYLLVKPRGDIFIYNLRTWDRYFYFLGFVNKKKPGLLDPIEISKTDFFDSLFSIRRFSD